MWKPDDPQGKESVKIRWDIVPYTIGNVLDVGCGPWKAFPHFTGLDNMHHALQFGWQFRPDKHVEDAANLKLFGDGAWDAVFSSHTLEHLDDFEAALAEWWRVLRVGGHLVLYLPHAQHYPNVGDRELVKKWLTDTAVEGETEPQAIARLVEKRRAGGISSIGKLYAGTPYANEDHKHDFMPGDITEAMMKLPGWDLIENEDRNEGTEYSFFQVYRKRDDKQCVIHGHPWKRDGAKLACVVRYGGFGDMIQASSILPGLKEQGYHVTVMTTPSGKNVLDGNPHVDRFLLQTNQPDQVPNQFLGDFWGCWRKKFDKWVNLSESVEGSLLATPGRANHGWPDKMRHSLMNFNYLEFTHTIAEVPPPPRPAFYPSEKDLEWAKSEVPREGFIIMWALAGSSVHKNYPHQERVVARIMTELPDAKIIMVGDKACQILEAGHEHERIMLTSGKWNIRQTLTAALQVDLVMGPETGVLNAVSMHDNAKVVLLSHSSHENLTRDWRNAVAFEPDAPCYPCHRMHYSRDFCPEWVIPVKDHPMSIEPGLVTLKKMTAEGHVKDGMFSTGSSICAASIPPDAVFDSIQRFYDAWRATRIIQATG